MGRKSNAMNAPRLSELENTFTEQWSIELNTLISGRIFLGVTAKEAAETFNVCEKTIYNFEKEITRDARLMSYYRQVFG